MEGLQKRLLTELSDKKRATTDKTVYNEFFNEILDSSEESKTNEACNLKTVSQLSQIV
jgi:hypothetical protein